MFRGAFSSISEEHWKAFWEAQRQLKYRQIPGIPSDNLVKIQTAVETINYMENLFERLRKGDQKLDSKQ